MWGGLAAWLVSLPTACGLVSLWQRISFRFMRYRSKTAFTIVPIQGGEDTEFILRGVLNRIKWLEGSGHEIWILDCGMDNTSAQICQKIAQDYPTLQIVTPMELEKCIKEFYKENKY